jgi:hypothetical protein
MHPAIHIPQRGIKEWYTISIPEKGRQSKGIIFPAIFF